MDIGEKIRELREDKNWNQSDLANSVGVSVSFISHLEIGRKAPSLKTLKKLEKVLDTDLYCYLDAA